MPVDGFVPSLVMALSPRRANAGSVRFHKPEIAPPANSNHPRDSTAARAAEASITVVIFCWHILLISESMDHHDSEIMDDRSID